MAQTLKPYPKYKDSGVSWLGKVPAHWSIEPGLSTFREKHSPNIGMIETTVLSLSYGSIVVKPPDKLHGLVPESFETYQIIDPGDIVIRPTDLQNDQTSLRVGIARDRGIITSAYMCLRTTDSAIPDYGYLLLHAYDLVKVFYGMGTGLRQNLDFTDLKRMPVVIPSEGEQECIVRFLAHANRRINRFIRAKRRLIELFNEQKRAIIHRAVTCGLDPNVRLKPSGIDWLGDVPEHWEVRRLRSLAKFVTSGSRGWAQYYSDEGPVFLRIGNISTESVDLKLGDIQRVRPPAGSEGERTRVEPDDVLVSITALMGAVGIVPQDLGEAYVNQHTALVRLDKRKCLPRWVAYFLISLAGKHQSYVFTSGGTKDGLELSDVKNLTVLLPSMDEQRHIIAEIDCDTGAIDIALHRALSQIDFIREYRSRLIADVVTGKLDVRRVELPALDEDEMIGEWDEGTEEEADETTETEEIALADV